MQHDNEIVSLTAQQLLDEGLHCYNQKNLKGALYFLEPLFLLEKNNSDLLQTIITILQEDRSYSKAEAYIDALLALKPEDENVQFIQAENLFHLQSYVKALPLYLKLHNLHPLNTHILQRLLAVYTKQNKRSEMKQVQALLEQAEVSTSHSQAEIDETVKVALSLVEQGMTDEAKVLLESVLLFDSENANANGIYGALLSDDNDYERALFYLDKIAFYSSCAYTSVYVQCLDKVRGKQSVVKYLEARVNKYPKEDASYKLLALHLHKNKEYSKAYPIYKSLIKKNNNDISLIRLKAISGFLAVRKSSDLRELKKLDAAAKELKDVYALLPDDERIITLLVRYYLTVGERKKAYDLVCNSKYKDENIKEWNKYPYYNASKNRALYFKSYLAGRSVRSSLHASTEYQRKEWNGESLKNKKVVILREQGVGDEILFASNYSWIISQAAEVSIFCSDRLKDEFSRLFPTVIFHTNEEVDGKSYVPEEKEIYLKSADIIILAGDLAVFQFKGTGEPLSQQNYYSITKEKKQVWERKLNNILDKRKIKVGLIWRSGTVSMARSVHYLNENDIAKIILSIPEVDFYNCMYVECDREVALINKLTGNRLSEISNLDQKNDFANTAAMLSCLDLVVGAYTATLSLAVAVATPAIAFAADYLKEDKIIEKEALYYKGVRHISFPINNSEERDKAIQSIINNVRMKLNL